MNNANLEKGTLLFNVTDHGLTYKRVGTKDLVAKVLCMFLICLSFLLFIYGQLKEPSRTEIRATIILSQPSNLRSSGVEANSEIQTEAARRLALPINVDGDLVKPFKAVRSWKTEKSEVLNYNNFFMKKFENLVSAKAETTNVELIEMVSDVIDTPTLNESIRSRNPEPVKTQLIECVLTQLKNKREGVFVEYMAGDGVEGSFTRYLEVKEGWSGLLIEPNPQIYSRLISNNRHSLSIQACISVLSHPQLFQDQDDDSSYIRGQNNNVTQWAPCFPLETLLLATGYKTVDYLALSSSMKVHPILFASDLAQLGIKVISVEYCPSNNYQAVIIQQLFNKGFTLISTIAASNIKSTEKCFNVVFVSNAVIDSM